MSAVVPQDPLPADRNLGPMLLISSSVLLFFVAITTTLRLYVRARNSMLGWDDYTIVIVSTLAVARLGCQVAQVRHDYGRHRWYINFGDYKVATMYGWYAQLCLFGGLCLLKISICLLLLRIKNEKWLRYLIWGVMGGLVLTNGGVIIILLAECHPIDAYWNFDGKCWDPRVRIYSIYFTIAYSILTDFLCSFLPLIVVWKVRIPLKKKLLVCGLMSLGLVATGCGIGRAASLSAVTDDFTWVFAIASIWANWELFLGTIAANLALSRSIYIHFFFGGGGGAGSGSGLLHHLRHHQAGDAAALHSDSQASSSRTAYLQGRLRCEPQFERPRTTIECGRGLGSGGGGGGGDGDGDGDSTLGGGSTHAMGIKKRTEFWISEEELQRQDSSSHAPSDTAGSSARSQHEAEHVQEEHDVEKAIIQLPA